MFLVSILGFSCMPDIVVLSENIFDIVLWVKKSKMAAICSKLNNNLISFLL